MRMKVGVLGLLLLLPSLAFAQSTTINIPWPVTGFATLSLTNASTLLSTSTVGPNSGIWPVAPQVMYVVNAPASGGTAFICPLGGTCTASNGIPIAAGAAYGFTRPATTMTAISASTSTLITQWGN